MKIPNVIPWTSEIDNQFCEEFWQLSETHNARKYTVAFARKIVDVLGSMGLVDDHALAVQLFMHLQNNNKAAFVDLLTQKENKSIGVIIQCAKKRAKNIFSQKGLPWTGRYYRFRRPDLIARQLLSTQEEVQLYHELFSEQESATV